MNSLDPSDLCSKTVALVGNPNVGKSTIFNSLTGGKQRTGNWTGKTVEISEGQYFYKGKTYHLIDLPGTYSLHGTSEEERVAANYIAGGQADCVAIVVNAACLQRSLSFVLQLAEMTHNAVLCLNLMDEAQQSGVSINSQLLEQLVKLPVIELSATKGEGLLELREKVRNICDGFMRSAAQQGERLGNTVPDYNAAADKIYEQCVTSNGTDRSERVDRLVLGRITGKLVMIAALFVLFWITIFGANYISDGLNFVFKRLGTLLSQLLLVCPSWFHDLLYQGVYSTTAKVVSVMMPPMLIFFPMFSYLEDLGFLPRVVFLMDRPFECCGSCGKQILTMSLGIGCNSVGVIGCRIISSPTQRLIAMITNAFIPCNGKFPTLLTLTYLFLSNNPFVAACIITLMVVLSIAATLLVTKMLSRSILKTDRDSIFTMEIPRYRRPKIKNILTTAFVDRVVGILCRAVIVAAPLGAIVWTLSFFQIDDVPLLNYFATKLDGIGSFLGMDGVILLAFLLSFPANELLFPLIILILTNNFSADFDLTAMRNLLLDGGWSQKTAVCTMLFTLFHWPCSTTCLTIRKETQSWKWTLAAFCLPTLVGVFLCAIIGLL